MANTQSKSSTRKTASKTRVQSSKKTNAVKELDKSAEPTQEVRSIVKQRVELDPNSIITVKNGFQGMLVYKSKKTGERFIWDNFGDEQDIELSELKSAKNSYKSFFINNWFLIEDPDVIDYLGVGQYYDNALTFEEFEGLFTESPEDIEKRISGLSKGQKRSVAFRARKLLAEGEVDFSIKVINTLERCLSIELIER